MPSFKLPTYDYRTWISFPDIKTGATFECNGNLWMKKSTRTAILIWPAGPDRTFYFSKSHPCKVKPND